MHAYDTRIGSGHALFVAMCMWSMAGVTVGALFVVGLEDDVGAPFEVIALAMASGQFDLYDNSVREAVGGVLKSHGVQRTAGQTPMQILHGLSPSKVSAIGSDVQKMLAESGGKGSAGKQTSRRRGNRRAQSGQGPIVRLLASPFAQAAPWARRAPGR